MEGVERVRRKLEVEKAIRGRKGALLKLLLEDYSI